MHLIIIIALGIFGGVWMINRWSDWQTNRQKARRLRQLHEELHPDLSKYAKTTPTR
jgi:hypothetical protein